MMKIFDVAYKSLKENLRNGWILLLTIIAAPFFVVIYFLISNTSSYNYDVVVISNDQGIFNKNEQVPINYVDSVAGYLSFFNEKLNVRLASSKQEAINNIQKNELDVIVELPDNFSAAIEGMRYSPNFKIPIHFMGDVSSYKYLNCAVWLYEGIESFIEEKTSIQGPVVFTEEGVGHSAQISEFDYQVPGLLIFAIIMIMYSAGITFIAEKENRTMLRLKLTFLTNREYIIGLSLVQLLISFVSIVLSLIVAVQLGFNHQGHFFQMVIISLLTAISIIAFSALIASFCSTTNQIIPVITLPLFLFMFLTGVMFPIDTPILFHLGDYPVYLNSILSPSFAVSAMHKSLILDAPFNDIIPDLNGLIIITIIYIAFGSYYYRKNGLNI